MDKAEARDILSHEEHTQRQRSYADLRELLGKPVTGMRNGLSGTAYQVETHALWDDGVGGNIRVLISIDDRGLRSLMPICTDFIIAQDGSFVGE